MVVSQIVGPPNLLFAPTRKVQHYPIAKYCSCPLQPEASGGGGGYSPRYSSPPPHILTVVVRALYV